jgi:hypothetical protein
METNQEDEANRPEVKESTGVKDSQSLQKEHKEKVDSLVRVYAFVSLSYIRFIFFKPQEQKQLQERIEKFLNILNGDITIGVHMQFLIKNNHADLLILKQIKVS